MYFDTKSDGLLTENFCSSVQIHFYVSTITVSGWGSLKFFLFCVSFQFLSYNVKILPIKWGCRCQHCFLTPLRKYLMTIFIKKINLLFIFWVWPNFFSDFPQLFSAGLPKLHFELLDGVFMEWSFFMKEFNFSNVLRFESTLLSKLFVKSFGWNCQTLFKLVERTLLRNFVSESSCTSTFVWLSVGTLLTFQKNCGCQNCN